jgi:hypothetical protein
MNTVILPEEAATMIHPTVKEACIRAMMRQGLLSKIRVGTRDYTTLESVNEYLSCLDHQNPRGSISVKTGMARKSGSSSTGAAKSGPDVLKAILQGRKKR